MFILPVKLFCENDYPLAPSLCSQFPYWPPIGGITCQVERLVLCVCMSAFVSGQLLPRITCGSPCLAVTATNILIFLLLWSRYLWEDSHYTSLLIHCGQEQMCATAYKPLRWTCQGCLLWHYTIYVYFYINIWSDKHFSPSRLLAVYSSQHVCTCFEWGASLFSCMFAPSGPDGVS